MLIFTNRNLVDRPDETAFTTRFTPAATTLGFADVAGSAGNWAVSALMAEASDAEALDGLLTVFEGPRRVLVYVHGNNNTPASCFERCALLEQLYGCEVVGFSWTSEGFGPDGSA